MPIDPPLRLKRTEDYVEQFLDLLRSSIRDRMRTGSVGILMSGGLDSTGMAAIAAELSRRQTPVKLRGHTLVSDRLIPDRERYFAGIAAAHLGIPVDFHAIDNHSFFESCLAGTIRPEPDFITPFGSDPGNDALAAIARHSRVAFYGEGPDNALKYEWKSYFRFERDRGHYLTILRDVASFPLLFREFPFLGRRAKQKRKPQSNVQFGATPPWLDDAFGARVRELERNRQDNGKQDNGKNDAPSPPEARPARPGGYQSLSAPLWQFAFESHDPGVTGLQVEVRNPFVDLRVLRFMLAVPAIPWCRDKYLLRRAFRRYLPGEIVSRPKTGVPVFLEFERWKEVGLPATVPLGALQGYVDIPRLAEVQIDGQEALGMKLRVLGLAFFLHSAGSDGYNQG